MSELTDAFKAAQAAQWAERFAGLPSAPADPLPSSVSVVVKDSGARVEPIAGFWDQMDNAAAHHDCPMKRVKGRCNCVLND